MPNVSLREVAKTAGCSATTVSLALRNDPRISEATRQRVKEVAEKLGYRPDPLVAIYQAHVRARVRKPVQFAIGWVNDFEKPDYWASVPYERPYFEGAKARAEQLGYHLDVISVGTDAPDEPVRRATMYQRIATARGIRGVLLPRLRVLNRVLEPWPDHFCAAVSDATGLLWEVPESRENSRFCPAASADVFANLRIAAHRLLQRGYKRPGLAIGHWQNNVGWGRIEGAWAVVQGDLPERSRVPLLFLGGPAPSYVFDRTRCPPEFPIWLKDYKPDVVICANSEVRNWVKELGLVVPRDLGLAHLQVEADVKGWSGICERREAIGAAGVDLIVEQLQSGWRAEGRWPKEVLIRGEWLDGETTRPPQ